MHLHQLYASARQNATKMHQHTTGMHQLYARMHSVDSARDNALNFDLHVCSAH
jgi:hypothetical protein